MRHSTQQRHRHSAAALLLVAVQHALAKTPLPCGENVVFLDLGANDGQSLTWFRKHWAPASKRKFTDVFAFEMNPVFADGLRQLLKPWDGTLIAAAAWTSDGTLTANSISCAALP